MEKKRELPKLLKVSQVAELLNCSVTNVYDIIGRRELTSIRIGAKGQHRIPFDELADLIERSTMPRRQSRRASM